MRSDNFSTYTDKQTLPLRHASSRPPRPRRSEKNSSPQPLPSLIKAGGKKLAFRNENGNLICVNHRAPSARPRSARPLQRAGTTPPINPGVNQSTIRTHLYSIRLLPHTNYNPIISHFYIIRLLQLFFAPLPLVSLSPLAHVSWRSCIKPVSYLLLNHFLMLCNKR